MSTTLTFAKALNTALADEMEADSTVVVFGEDVGPLGGVFRITDGLTARFGEERCFDTPLAESGIMGMAIGMAMNGLRPVVEMQFDAFAYPAFEQVVSHVAKMPNRTKGKVKLPMVIRIPYAGGIGGVPALNAVNAGASRMSSVLGTVSGRLAGVQGSIPASGGSTTPVLLNNSARSIT